MQAKPIILAKTTYDFDTLFKTSKQALGYGVNRTIDTKRLKYDTQKYYAALSEFRDEDYSHTGNMEGIVLDYFHYVLGLIVEDHIYHDLLHFKSIHAIRNSEIPSLKRGYTYCIASGTLRGWRDAVVDGSTKESSLELRELMTAIFGLFTTEGLITLWADYKKMNINDTIVLIPQK